MRVYTRRAAEGRREAKRVGREVRQGLRVDLGPGEGLEARLLEEKFITKESNQYGGCWGHNGGCHCTPTLLVFIQFSIDRNKHIIVF